MEAQPRHEPSRGRRAALLEVGRGERAPHTTATALSAARDSAVARLTSVEDVQRAFMLMVLSEFNAHTAKVNAILSAIGAATTLANLKTAVAAITDLPVRTEQQLRTAIRNNLGT